MLSELMIEVGILTNVNLVGNNDKDDVVKIRRAGQLVSYFVHPRFQCLETDSARHIKDQENAVCIRIEFIPDLDRRHHQHVIDEHS